MTLRTPLGQVRGLGSAKDGTAHWMAQRVTAVALVPLVLWLVASLVSLAGADQAAVTQWIGRPHVAVILTLLIIAAFHHGQLGLQVVIEDYVSGEWRKFACIMAVRFAAIALGVVGIFAIVRIALVSGKVAV